MRQAEAPLAGTKCAGTLSSVRRAEAVRAVGFDLGQQRIGVAVTDAGGRLAVPFEVVTRSGDLAHDRVVLAAIVDKLGAEIVVVGLPVALSGAIGQAARAAEAEAAALGEVIGVPVVTFDERLTTVEAERRRRELREIERSAGASGRSARGGGRPRRRRGAAASGSSRQRRAGLDAEAAAIMLGSWLGSEQ